MLEFLLRKTHAEHLKLENLLRKMALEVSMPEFLFRETGVEHVRPTKKH